MERTLHPLLASLVLIGANAQAQQADCTSNPAACYPQQQTYPQSGYPATGYPQSTYPQNGALASGLGTGSYGQSSNVQGAPPSALGNRGGAYGGASPFGAQAASPGAIQPTAAAQAGNGACVPHLSGDRSSIALTDTGTNQDRATVSLGQDHVQQLFKSPDGAWAVAVFKLRGREQYGAVVLDLAGCAQGETADLSAAADSAQFNGAEVALALKGGASQNLPLKPAAQ